MPAFFQVACHTAKYICSGNRITVIVRSIGYPWAVRVLSGYVGPEIFGINRDGYDALASGSQSVNMYILSHT